MESLRIPNFEFINFDADAKKYLHPGASCMIKCNGLVCGSLGAVHPEVLTAFDIAAKDIYIFELELAKLFRASNANISSRDIPRFPQIKRDLSFTVSDDVQDSGIMSFLKKSRIPYLTDYGVFDLYRGKGIPAGHKSMAYYFVFASPERTLLDSDVDDSMNKIIDGLKKEFLINIR